VDRKLAIFVSFSRLASSLAWSKSASNGHVQIADYFLENLNNLWT